jgi:hypothetical protein
LLLLLQYARYVGLAICCFGIVGPLMGLLSKSRQAVVAILWMELIWTGGCSILSAFDHESSSSGERACIVPVRLSSGERQTGCLFTGDVNVAICIVAFVLFISYAVSLLRVRGASMRFRPCVRSSRFQYRLMVCLCVCALCALRGVRVLWVVLGRSTTSVTTT